LNNDSVIHIATRGSALALAQTNMILAQCRAAFPALTFEIRIIKTTGDKLQTASLAQEAKSLPKGLFTKELEVALLDGTADLAVHSLKDLPTELPAGLVLGAVCEREDVRDVMLYREASAGLPGRGYARDLRIQDLPAGAVVATSSTRRKAQLLVANPGLKVPDIRGNVGTRMRKVAENADLDATLLAFAGLKRLSYQITPEGRILGKDVPHGLLATVLGTDVMLPCVGQAAIGIETREGDERIAELCRRLNHPPSYQAVTAERAFLEGMGGGCQSPVAAHARVSGDKLEVSVLSFASGPVRRASRKGAASDAAALGRELATELR
jgi:hydroxymethylbilane synthase